jgi:hypothetical protein
MANNNKLKINKIEINWITNKITKFKNVAVYNSYAKGKK